RLRDSSQGVGGTAWCDLWEQGSAAWSTDSLSHLSHSVAARAGSRRAEGDGRLQNDGRLASIVLRAGSLGSLPWELETRGELGGKGEDPFPRRGESRICGAVCGTGLAYCGQGTRFLVSAACHPSEQQRSEPRRRASGYANPGCTGALA